MNQEDQHLTRRRKPKISRNERYCHLPDKPAPRGTNTPAKCCTHHSITAPGPRIHRHQSRHKKLAYDLIALNHHHMLLIAARRQTKQQTAKQILQNYQDLISDIQYTPAPPSAKKQSWVYQNGHGCSMYNLFQNGIMRRNDLP
jgi:hypothetical protein